MKNLMKILVVIFVMLSLLGNVEAGWKDKLGKARDNVRSATEKTKDAGRRTKERWKESEKRCDLCDKVVHGRSRCYSCRTKEAKDSVKKSWDNKARACSVCSKTIHVGSMCAKCSSLIIKKYGSGVASRISARSTRAFNSAKEKYGFALDKVQDPEVRGKTTETIGVVLELRRKYKETKFKGAYKGMQMLASVPIPGRDGEMTNLGDFASDKLLEKCPGLASTGITDDPAATVAAIICTDRNYFLKESKFVKTKDGRNVSVYEAVEESSAFNSVKASKSFAVMAATERVANTYYTGEDGLEALTSVADAINSINK